MMRVFYVVYPQDRAVRAWLNLLRALANPHQKESVHITVRGPYRQRHGVPAAAVKIADSLVRVPGPDAFFGERQATVFLRCEAEQLRPLWRKRDYPAFTPHVTLCDGMPRDLAEQVLERLRRIPPFVFRISPLQPLFSQANQTTLGLLGELDYGHLSSLTDRPMRSDDLLRLSVPERLVLLDTLVADVQKSPLLFVESSHPANAAPQK